MFISEREYLKKSEKSSRYPGENYPIIEALHISDLGKLAALTFLSWVIDHPDGVVALPTGRTPEYFIKHLHEYRKRWNEHLVQEELRRYGIELSHFPKTEHLKFVQLDEFYPLHPAHKKSFTRYVQEHYLSLLQIPVQQALTMEFALREGPATPDEENRFCQRYEEQIRQWGGIGFFLGGIGFDGHIAFNMPGSSFDSPTRIVEINYPTAAQVASDLGGIEFSRSKKVITIGLGTIRFNPDAVIIIFAAGEGKASVVAEALTQPPSNAIPATAFFGMAGARFYLTKGAGLLLPERRAEEIRSSDSISDSLVDEVILDLALKQKKSLLQLTEKDFLSDPKSASLKVKLEDRFLDEIQKVRERLLAKIEKGSVLPKGKRILHTGPHHDDVMLSYYPLLGGLIEDNDNFFVYLTSGYNAVTDSYMASILDYISDDRLTEYSQDIFQTDYSTLLHRYVNMMCGHNEEGMKMIEALISLRNLSSVYHVETVNALKAKRQQLRDNPKNSLEMKLLKGAMRESEEDRMLASLGVSQDNVHHFRADFYSADKDRKAAAIHDDAERFFEIVNRIRPDIITVAMDPESTGPDTHHQVLEVIVESLKLSKERLSPEIWGYRNVWHRFSLGEASICFPVNEEELEQMNQTFMGCYSTQKNASFPSPHYDGPFSKLSEQIQREQYLQLQILLGEDHFANHPEVVAFILFKIHKMRQLTG